MNENELKHYGIPGMRWGHRKGGINGNTKSRHQKRYEDENGFNPNRPNGTPLKNQKLINALKPKPTYAKSKQQSTSVEERLAKMEKKEKARRVGKVVKTILGTAAIGALTVGALKATAGVARGLQAVHELNMSGLDMVRDLTFFL